MNNHCLFVGEQIPDRDYENFWLTFKGNILGSPEYMTPISRMTPVTNTDTIAKIEEIHTVSNLLNRLQKEKRYADIVTRISIYLIDFGWTLLKVDNQYTENIYFTNIKRWMRLTQWPDNILLDLTKIKRSCNKYKEYFYPVIARFHRDQSTDQRTQLFSTLLDLAFEHNRGNVIDILSAGRYIDLHEYCMRNFSIEIPHLIKGVKLLHLVFSGTKT